MHNATAITTGSANQRPNTPCIKLWIDVPFRGLEHSYTPVEYTEYTPVRVYGAFDRLLKSETP